MSNKEKEFYKFNEIMKNNQLDHLVKVYKVNFIEKNKIVTLIKEFNSAEERSRWFENEGRKIIESEKRGCLVYGEGSPEIIEMGRIVEKPKD
jgi:hypothetical protein